MRRSRDLGIDDNALRALLKPECGVERLADLTSDDEETINAALVREAA